MTVRLTKALREEIIEKIYKASDLPKRLEDLEASAKKKAADIVRSTWPEGFAEAIKTLPREWFGSVTHVYISSCLRREGAGGYFDLSSETIGPSTSATSSSTTRSPTPRTSMATTTT